ncbi:MAG: hypothetical protein PWP46_1706 [Fusobacteriaceae bacterium]|jgi:uncharacterized protein YcfL|nr:hypothetical protein [Fusobacteriaceae bacterium]
MRKIFIPLLLSVLLLSGCETLKISAPREKNIILEQKTKNDNIRADKEKKYTMHFMDLYLYQIIVQKIC